MMVFTRHCPQQPSLHASAAFGTFAFVALRQNVAYPGEVIRHLLAKIIVAPPSVAAYNNPEY